MKRKLLILVVLLFCSMFVVACGDTEVKKTVYHYRIANVKSAVNLRAGASSSTAAIGQIPLGEEVDALSRDGDWYRVKTADGKTGYVHNSFIAMTSEVIIVPPPTLAGKLHAADQHCAAVFSFLEELRARYDSRETRTWGFCIASVLIWVLALIIYASVEIAWWHYLLLLLFSPAVVFAFCVCEPLQPAGFDVFIFDLIVGLLLLSSPSALWHVMVVLLSGATGGGTSFAMGHLVMSGSTSIPVAGVLTFAPESADTADLV
ncbi:MAG: SH3 domain-containing protein, partial [Alistipes sp.]|nr:SH3 domain-containing protein [Alistipes sp.]